MSSPSLAQRLLSLCAAAPLWTPTSPEYTPPSPETVKRRNARTRSRTKGNVGDEEEVSARGVRPVMAIYEDCTLHRDFAGGTYLAIDGKLFPLDQKCRELKERMAHDSLDKTGKVNSESINQV